MPDPNYAAVDFDTSKYNKDVGFFTIYTSEDNSYSK